MGESTSLVRFWTDSFSNFVRPERNAKGDRKYTPKDIENLRIIHHLVKDKKMTLEGAAARMKGNKEGLDNRAEVVQRLKGIKEMLQDIAKSIDE